MAVTRFPLAVVAAPAASGATAEMVAGSSDSVESVGMLAMAEQVALAGPAEREEPAGRVVAPGLAPRTG